MDPAFQVLLYLILLTIVFVALFLMLNEGNEDSNRNANLKKIKKAMRAKEAKQTARKLKRLPDSAVFIDTETTGLNDGYEIIEIAIVNMQGEILYEAKIKPTIPIEVNATKVHGLSDSDVEDEPSFAAISEEVYSYISGKKIAGYNIEYDIKALKNSAAANNVEVTFNFYTFCVMNYANEILSQVKNIKLTKLCKLLGVKYEGAHSASVDALLTFQVFKKINQIERRNLTNNLNQWSGFINLELDNLADASDGEALVLWGARDERMMLFSRGSLMGSGKIAELDTNLTLDVNKIIEQGGDVQFIARPLALPPEIEIRTFSKKEAEAAHQEALNKYKQELKNELQQAKLPAKNKLRGIINNDRPDLPGWVNFSEVGDLFIENKTLEEFLAGEAYVQLTTLSGDIIFKQHLNKFWKRIIGVITKGYKAKVVFIEYGKSNNVKVDVLFEQISE